MWHAALYAGREQPKEAICQTEKQLHSPGLSLVEEDVGHTEGQDDECKQGRKGQAVTGMATNQPRKALSTCQQMLS